MPLSSRITLALSLIMLCARLHAQDTAKRTSSRVVAIRRSTPLDTNMVVYDENETPLRYYQYQKLLGLGQYTIRLKGHPGDPDAKKYLIKATPEVIAAARKRLKTDNFIPGPSFIVGHELDVTPLTTVVNSLELDNKVLVLVFWNSGCAPCTENFANINELFAQIHNPEKLTILAITTDDKSIASIKLNEKPLLHARLISSAREILKTYQFTTYPAYVVTDKDHIIRFATKGMTIATIPAFKDAILEQLKK